MFKQLVLLILISAVGAVAQSGRVAPGSAKQDSPEIEKVSGVTVKQMFDEVNEYSKNKFAEFEQKKVPYSDNLRKQTQQEQKQLAAKYAAIAGQRADLSGDDFYYLGMLHWIAENFDGAVPALQSFLASGSPLADRAQTARSVITVIEAKKNDLAAAEKYLAEYLAARPIKLTERARMESELGKAYMSAGTYDRAAAHGLEAYAATKAIAADPALRSRVIDQLLDNGMLVFEAYTAAKKISQADAALEELRKAGAAFGSPSLYYYAADREIRYMIDTSRKAAALQAYAAFLEQVPRDLTTKAHQQEVIQKLKKRELHYKLLGEPAPELTGIDKWLGGAPVSLAGLKGKVVLIDFWATWCAPCFEAFPTLIELDRDHGADGLVILGVTRYYGMAEGFPVDDNNELEFLRKFKQAQRLPYEFGVAKDAMTQKAWGATSLPTAVIIDRKGIVRYLESGTNPSRLDEMRDIVVKLLSE